MRLAELGRLGEEVHWWGSPPSLPICQLFPSLLPALQFPKLLFYSLLVCSPWAVCEKKMGMLTSFSSIVIAEILLPCLSSPAASYKVTVILAAHLPYKKLLQQQRRRWGGRTTTSGVYSGMGSAGCALV